MRREIETLKNENVRKFEAAIDELGKKHNALVDAFAELKKTVGASLEKDKINAEKFSMMEKSASSSDSNLQELKKSIEATNSKVEAQWRRIADLERSVGQQSGSGYNSLADRIRSIEDRIRR